MLNDIQYNMAKKKPKANHLTYGPLNSFNCLNT